MSKLKASAQEGRALALTLIALAIGFVLILPPSSGVPDAALYGVFFVDANNGWAVGTPLGDYGTIVHTTDGGDNWQQQIDDDIPKVALRSVFFPESTTGWAVGDKKDGHGTILRTTNAGVDWTRQTTGVPDIHLYSISLGPSTTTARDTHNIVSTAGGLTINASVEISGSQITINSWHVE